MTFALCPENGYPRIWRYVDKDALPDNIVSTLDPVQNVQVIRRDLFDQLTDLEKLIVQHTRQRIVYFPNVLLKTAQGEHHAAV